MRRAVLAFALVLAAACGSSPSAGGGGGPLLADADAVAGTDAAPTGQGAAALNVTPCDPKAGWKSAVRAATGVQDPAQLANFAAALGDAGYQALYHPGDEADAGAAGDATEPAPPPPAEDAGSTEDTGDVTAAEDVAALADAVEHPVHGDKRTFVAAIDTRNDAVFLLHGDLYVASACPLDRLGQVRRLDYALAAAAKVLTALDHPGDWKLETARWSRPDTFYGGKAGAYWRQYLDEATDLTKPLQGTLSLASKPSGLAMAVYGHADVPSDVGDVVRLQSLTVAGKKLLTSQTWQVHDVAALVWDLAQALMAGELAYAADLLVADAGVAWNVGTYRVFFEALFEGAPTGLGVSAQGALPGALRVSHVITELDLPAAPTRQ